MLIRNAATIFVTLSLLVGAAGRSAAQTDDLDRQHNLFELGIYAGAMIPGEDHDLVEVDRAQYAPLRDAAFVIGGRMGYLPWPMLALEIEGGLVPTSITTGDTATLYHLRGHLLLQYPARFAPFLVVGGGMLGVSSEVDVLGKDLDGAFHWGLGLKAYLTDWLLLRLDGRHIVSDGGTPTSRGDSTDAEHHFEVLAGLSFVLGWEHPVGDRDGDGLTDDKDKCPDEPASTPDGCPLRDRDGDGLTDDKDKCPDEPASTPDGCPLRDRDGDGVTDDKDKCPDEPASTPDGCPPKDSDGDGIVDEQDRCPQQPETKNGYQDADGCPDELPKQIKRFTGAIRGITFEVNKAKIRRSSYKTLDAAVKVLKEYPELKLIIRGHTDITGKRDHNLELSRQRAQSVRDYLVGKGIDASRLSTEGLGPDEPVADNKTRAGRAQNRRIEFKIDVR